MVEESTKKKTYVLDTNVLISDPESIYSFEENDVVIPMAVIRELDKLKSRPGEVGQNSRLVSRRLNDYRSKYPKKLSNEGVLINEDREESGFLRIVSVTQDDLQTYEALGLSRDIPDDQIIMTACAIKPIASGQTILVSNDFNVLLKAEHIGLKCEEYRNIRISETSKMYSGCVEIDVLSGSIVDLYSKGTLCNSDQELDADTKYYPNQFVTARSHASSESFVGRYLETSDDGVRKFQRLSQEVNVSVFGLIAKNKEQKFALEALLNDEIKLVTLTGPSGTGKTILAIAAGLQKTIYTGGSFERLIVTRPVEPIGRDLGFLPGTFEEKMLPWIQPIYDNISFLTSQKTTNRMPGSKKYDSSRKKFRNVNEYDTITNRDPYIAELQESGRLEIEAITYIRGRSIPRSYMIIDEAQNLSMHALKTLITRAGDGTKIVLTGDIEQIDNLHVDAYTNGLSHAVEKFKHSPLSAHVTLKKGQRSDLATLASKIL